MNGPLRVGLLDYFVAKLLPLCNKRSITEILKRSVGHHRLQRESRSQKGSSCHDDFVKVLFVGHVAVVGQTVVSDQSVLYPRALVLARA